MQQGCPCALEAVAVSHGREVVGLVLHMVMDCWPMHCAIPTQARREPSNQIRTGRSPLRVVDIDEVADECGEKVEEWTGKGG